MIFNNYGLNIAIVINKSVNGKLPLSRLVKPNYPEHLRTL